MGNCCARSDFDIVTEQRKDGSQKVKLDQPLPVPFKKLIANEQLLIRLLTVNGEQNIKSI